MVMQQNKRATIAYLSVAAAVFALTAVGCLPAGDFYRKFLGDVSPLIAITGSIIVGFASLVVITRLGWVSVTEGNDTGRVLPLFALAAVPPLVAVVIDLFVHFPEDMNQSFPASLAFYPSIGFLVEVVFHLVPIAVFLLLLECVVPDTRKNDAVWEVLLIAALIEPSYQTISMVSGGHPLAVLPAVFVNLLLFNGIQMVLFKRSGFFAMYGSRLVYYAIWHIIWGHLRTGILFR